MPMIQYIWLRAYIRPLLLPALACLLPFALQVQAADSAPATIADPTQPPAEVLTRLPQSADQAALTPELTAVKNNGKASFAIINQTMVRLGERIQGNRLVAVTQNSATLVNEAKQKTVLRLGVVDYRKPVQANLPPKKPTTRKRVAPKPVLMPDAK